MIAFDCPHCQKPLIVANTKAGSRQPCPGCKETVVVPLPRVPSFAARYGKPIALLAVLIIGALGLGWKVHRDHEPDRLKRKIAAALQAQSPRWQGFDWEKCEPQVGDYRFNVFYLSPRKRYVFAVTSFTPAGQTFVDVDPVPSQSTALSSLSFAAGEIESFRYFGGNDEERDELETLSQEVARIVTLTAR